MDITKTKSKEAAKGSIKNTLSGSPKKGGAGGKGTWGKGGIDDLNVPRPKKGDPDYDSADEDNVVLDSIAVQHHHSPIEDILRDFFSEADESEVIRRIKEEKIKKEDFVRKAVYLSMEQQAYQRELVSKLLSTLCGSTITSEQFAEGFTAAIDKLDDYELDIPQAPDMLSKFIARAIVDEIIPPAFLKTCFSDSKNSKEVVKLASALVNDSHRSRKLGHIWGPGDHSSVNRMKQELHKIIDEYISNEDKPQADQALRQLNSPSFHFHIVRYAIRSGVETTNAGDRKKALDLLLFLYKEGLLSQDSVLRGFEGYRNELPDHKLDAPNAPAIFEEIVQSAQKAGILSVDFKSTGQQ